MAEYINVEKPFLEKLSQLGWQVIDQGCGMIPQDPAKSLRTSFRDVALEQVFKESIRKINLTDDGREWLTDKQLDDIYREVTLHLGKGLLEANRAVFDLLAKNTIVTVNELTGEHNPLVRLVDFKRPERNSFIAINQFRIDTPGGPRDGIIPDIVLFVNGLPWVVVECKDVDVAEPLSEAFIQICRYSNRRDDDYSVQEGDERLFHFNLFSIITHGTEARFGTITGEFDHYQNWKDIFPEEYRTIQVSPNEERQEVLMHGILNKAIMLDIFKNFTLFMEVKKGELAKVVCRYQQYRAVGKIIQRLRSGNTPFERSGVIWHTQGSGKSLTMVFLVRKMRDTDDLKDFKIIMINDRSDLEDQLSDTAELTGEKVNIVDHRRDLRPMLKDDASNLNMVMVHKFLTTKGVSAQSLIDSGIVPQFEPFETVNESERILLLIDEAHRTQGGDMGDNLFAAFPQGARIAFTGTPLLTDRHKTKTHERFGSFIDTYKMKQSVADRATVDILYIGRTSKDHILDREIFEAEFDDMFRERSDEEKQEIQRRYGTMVAYLESKDRIRKIAEDIVEHYTREILPNGFKAQVVVSSIVAACRCKYEIDAALKVRIEKEKAKPAGERDDELIRQMEFVKVAAVVTMMENNEPGYVSQARRQAQEWNAVENFKKDFGFEKPETGIAILCVCDRLLTGFDAPIEQVMYLDKSLREHDLMQAIARVNRPKVMKNGHVKQHGIVIDYFGVAQHLKEALAIYTETDEKELEDFSAYFRDINKELPVLEARYKRLVQLFSDYGIKEIEDFVYQRIQDHAKESEVAEACVALAANVSFRAQFDVYIKAFFDSLDLLFNVREARDYYIPAKRFGYLLLRMRNRYKDETLDLKWAGAKVRKLIDKHVQSLGIDSKMPPVKLLSADFPKEIDKYTGTPRSKASEMEHAIRHHIKVNLDKDPSLYTKFNERLEKILRDYKEKWDLIVLELSKMRDAMTMGRTESEFGVSSQEAPFFELIEIIGFSGQATPEQKEKLKQITRLVYERIRQALQIPNLFEHKTSEVRRLTNEIDDELQYAGIAELRDKHQQLTTEILNLARNRESEIKKL